MLGRRTLVAVAALTTLVPALGATAPATAERPAPTCWGAAATIVGSGLVRGTEGDDVIVSRGGEVHALGGDDRVCGAFLAFGGAGDDRIGYGGDDGDFPDLRGGRGDDVIVLTVARFAHLYGGPGADRLHGTGGSQWIAGDRGDDVLLGGYGEDHLFGGPGRDLLRGGRGPDVGDGGPDPDTCRAVEDSSSCER